MERSHSREWGKTEKDTICAAAGLLGATFSRITQEDEIKRREDNFRHFFNTIDDYVFVLEPSGEIVEMNHAASRTLNGEREPVTGTTLSSFIIHEYRETFLADLDLSAKGAKISRQSSLFISGSRITVEMLLVNGVWNEKRRIYCICKDISEIMASREKFSQVFHSSHAMHTIRRVSDHTLIDVNETYLKTLGYSREEVFEHAQTEACSDPLQYQMIWEEVCRKGALRDAELNLHTRDGRIIYGLYNGVIIDVNGDSCVLSTIMNISKIMQAERRVHDLLEELSLSNRDLEEFAYIVSHDLKAPLRGITSLILWLEDDPLNSFSDKGKTYLKTLSERVTYMQRLIDGILAYSRAGKRIEEKQPVDSGDLVMEVIHLLSPPDSLTIHIPGNLPVVLIERMKLFQVFQNLIGNAITYISRPDGVITITASEKKTGITFCIEDNGPGIHPDFHDRIFEMFSRFQEPSFESTGLGLSIVKRIVEMNGGRVWVESEPGKGSRFFFFIPQ
jgi:PAS domain S-box-containing protein